ncbi:MAG TPA: metallophosphoesterase [Chloroflexota bacterium]|nr:metallophosphoesterase [Chloroflexota bacterium]
MATTNQRRVRFAVLGDTHFVDPPPAVDGAGPGRKAPSASYAFSAEVTRTTWPRIAAQIRAAAPDFVIQTGDLVHGGWDDAAANEADLRAALARLETLGCPVLVAQGNHDRSPAAIAVPAWRSVVLPWVAGQLQQLGCTHPPEREYYLADVGGCRIVVLDPTLEPGDAQHAFLRRVLAEQAPPRRFVAGHYPIVPLGRPAFAPFPYATTLGPQLAAAGVDAYLCAHTHNQTVSVHHYAAGPLLQVTGSPMGVLPGTAHRFGSGVLPLEVTRALWAGPHPCQYLWGFLEDTAPGWYLIDAAANGVTLTWHTVTDAARAHARWEQPGLISEFTPPPGRALPAVGAADLAHARAARLRLAGHGAPAGMPVRLNGTAIGALPALGSFAPAPVLELAPEHLSLLRLENEVEIATPVDAALLLGALLIEVDRQDGSCVRTRPSPRLWTTLPAAGPPARGGLDQWVAGSGPDGESWFGEHLTRISPGDVIRAGPVAF